LENGLDFISPVSCAENLPDAQLTTQSSHWMLFELQGVLYSVKYPAKQ